MSARSPDVDIITFGCRLNAYESEVIRARAAEDGLTDAVVFNTCAVTGEAVRQARQAIRKARRERPGAKLIVTGCAAQIDPAAFAAMAEVDLVLGNAEKSAGRQLRPGRCVGAGAGQRHHERARDGRPSGRRAEGPGAGLSSRSRTAATTAAPSASSRSGAAIRARRAAGEVVEQVRRLTAQGYREVVLTGVDVTSWGADLPGQPTLGQLVARILKLVPELPRLRLSSIDAAEIDADLLRCLGRRAAADALPAPVAAGRRRHDPQADEAPPQPRRRAEAGGRGARRAAGHRLRRRFHRRLPHRDRGDVREHAEAGRGGGPLVPARLPLQRPARHAGGADARREG